MGAGRDILESASIYVAGRYLGEVIAVRCGSYEAADAQGRTLGMFADPRAAADAILRRSGAANG